MPPPHLVPVLCNLAQTLRLADVHKVEHILLEAGATESHGGVQELGADTGVVPQGSGDLRYRVRRDIQWIIVNTAVQMITKWIFDRLMGAY